MGKDSGVSYLISYMEKRVKYVIMNDNLFFIYCFSLQIRVVKLFKIMNIDGKDFDLDSISDIQL